jgi:fibronectin type 3 domain-containing protein
MTKKSRIVFFLITFVCVLALIGTAADSPKQKVDKNRDRLIELADSPVRIMLNGNQTYRISMDGKNFTRELPQRHTIGLGQNAFDPLVNPPRENMMPEQSHEGIKLFIVQCFTQPIEEFQKQVAALGGEVCGTLPGHALIVAMSDADADMVRSLPLVRWMGPYLADYKLQVQVGPAKVMGIGKTHYSLWLAKKNKQEDVAKFIKGIGGEVVLRTKSRRMEAKLNDNQLRRTAALPWVLAVDLRTPYGDDMNNVREISGANYIETVQGYTGQGVRGEVCDDGLRTTHQEFQYNPPIFHYSNDSDNNHGTSVYSIIFASGVNPEARGLLPDAEQPIFASRYHYTDRYTHTQELVNPGGTFRAVFQTNSWGSSQTTSYTSASAEMDEIIFDLDIIITQSQSNTGERESRPQAWAKNIVAVGGVRHYNTLSRSDDVWNQSASIGPASDGRVKPDVWHFYDYTRAAYYTGDAAYTDFGGTSGATPITAGHLGLIFQMWADGVFAGAPGQARDVFNYRPHFTTAKALLIHSAYQYPFSGTSHDKTRMHQGWGMADVQNLYNLAEGHNWNLPVLIDESAVITPLEIHTYNVNVDGTQPLKATLVYADPPCVPGASPHRINDLTLKVTSPGSTVYWGNNGLDVGVWSTSGGSANTIDTVENVFIETPAVGTWTIQVLADEVVQDSHVETPALDADYALVVSGGSSGPPDPPPAAPTGLTATAGLRLVNLDWNDNTEPDLDSYNVKRATTAGGPYTTIDSVTISSYTDNAVTAGTTYYYVVTAVDAGSHESGNSNEASATPYDNPPAAPSGLTANAPACDQVDLNWVDNSGNETSFKIERGPDGINFSQIDTVGADVTSYSDTTVVENTTYYYRVRASNAFGDSGYSNTASVTTPACPTNPPAAPSNLKLKGKRGKVEISWTDNSNDEDGFRIYRGLSAGSLSLVDTVGPNTTAYVDTGLANKTTYYYKVCSFNVNGESCTGVSSIRTK